MIKAHHIMTKANYKMTKTHYIMTKAHLDLDMTVRPVFHTVIKIATLNNVIQF